MSVAALQGEIFNQLQYINSTFVEDGMKDSPYAGKFASSSFAGSSFLDNLFAGYSTFETSYTNNITAPVQTLSTALLSRIALSNTYSSRTLLDSNNNPVLQPSFLDINMSKFINSGSDLATHMDKIRKLYTLLEPSNYTKYKNQSDVTISKYYVGADGDARVTYGSAAGNSPKSELYALVNELSSSSLATTAALSNTAGAVAATITNVTSSVTAPTGVSDSIYRIAKDSSISDYSMTPMYAFRPPSSPSKLAISFKAKVDGNSSSGTCDVEVIVNANGAVYKSPTVTLLKSAANWTDIHFVTPVLPQSTSTNHKFGIKFIHKGYNAPVNVTALKVEYGSAPTSLQQLINTSKTDLFVIRRLLLLYECMAHCYIAMKVFEIVDGNANTSAANKAYALAILTIAFENLLILNRNNMSTGANSVQTIANTVSQRMKTYKDNTIAINEMSDSLVNQKIDLNAEVQRLNSTNTSYDRAKRYMYTTIGVSVAIVVSGLLAYVLPMKPALKVGAAASLTLVAFITAFVLNMTYGKSTEGFTGNTYTLQAYYQIQGLNATADKIAVFNQGVLTEAQKYLTNTLYLANMLQMNVSYGNVNYAMGKEKTFFEDTALQMDNSTTTVAGATRVVRLERTTANARITFAITVAIIVAAAILAIVSTSKYPASHPFIVGAAAFFVVVAIAMYVLDTSARVRTDGVKKYWAKPEYREA